MVSTKIAKINRIIASIDAVISYIDDLLNMNFSMLEITTEKGSTDIYDQLMNASGFAGAETGRPMYMGGIVFAFGGVNSTGLSFDWQTFVQDSASQAEDLKGEVRKIQATAPPGTSGFFDRILKG